MKALVIGGGGREHALAWRLAQSPTVTALHATPGNPGIAQVATCHATKDYLALAKHLQIDLTVVGPEAPLVDGIVDQFRAEGLRIVGPTSANAALEGSKIYAKRFMDQQGIPTARFVTATTPTEARDALGRFQYPVVLKTDGLAAGKGVVIAKTIQEAEEALAVLPCPMVVEEFLEGEEVSFIALCDGHTAVPLEPSQDHKRVFDNDEGPNTGGMGAYSDARILTEEQRRLVMETVILPVVRATGFTGFLYAGLMMTANGPRVLEFNVRMGDPETQPLMMRLQSDWAHTLSLAASGQLSGHKLQWSPAPAACVVMASPGYPGTFQTGLPITGLELVREATVFHAGTRISENGTLVNSGGRVLGVTATAETLTQALQRAYAAVSQIHFPGAHYRTDIGRLGILRQ